MLTFVLMSFTLLFSVGFRPQSRHIICSVQHVCAGCLTCYLSHISNSHIYCLALSIFVLLLRRQRTGRYRDDAGARSATKATSEGGVQGGGGEVGVSGSVNTRTMRGGSADNAAGGVRDGVGNGRICGKKRRQQVEDIKVCSGQRRRLVTLSQWGIVMLDQKCSMHLIQA